MKSAFYHGRRCLTPDALQRQARDLFGCLACMIGCQSSFGVQVMGQRDWLLCGSLSSCASHYSS